MIIAIIYKYPWGKKKKKAPAKKLVYTPSLDKNESGLTAWIWAWVKRLNMPSTWKCGKIFVPYTGNKIIQTKIPVDSPSKPQKYIYEWLPTKMYFLTNFLLYFVIHVSLTRVRHEYVNLTKISFQFGPGIHLELVTYNNYSPFKCSKLQSFFFFSPNWLIYSYI